MNILHVITTINRGGAENHLAELVRAQVSQGAHVVVAYLKGNGYWAGHFQNLGVRVEHLGLGRYGDIRPLIRLRGLIRRLGPDIVHAHMPPAEIYARLALMAMRSPPAFIISKHNDERFYPGPGQAVVGAWVASRASRMIAISDAVNAYARAQLGLPASKVTTIHYGIDPRPYEAADEASMASLRCEWGIADDVWIIGTVARLVPQKALHVLLEAYARYRSTATRPSWLVLVGSGPLEVDLKAQAARLGIADSTLWAGFREDIPRVMKTFDTFALTSAYEGFGLVLLEAMAAATPIIATAVSAIPEIVQDGVNGKLCQPGDPACIAAAFLELEDTELRDRLGAAGHARACRMFTVERMANATRTVYHESLST
jgi:glycosyltransferase involved in cell wall biosynthesis